MLRVDVLELGKERAGGSPVIRISVAISNIDNTHFKNKIEPF